MEIMLRVVAISWKNNRIPGLGRYTHPNFFATAIINIVIAVLVITIFILIFMFNHQITSLWILTATTSNNIKNQNLKNCIQ